MVGKKGYKISESQTDQTLKNNNENIENSEFILDLDELHMNVTPPSELNENCSPKTEGKIILISFIILFLNFCYLFAKIKNMF